MIDIELYEDEILDEELEDIIEEDEVIEDEIDDSHDSTENRETLETKYDTYNEAYDEIVFLLKSIVEKGELTQEDKDNMDLMNDRYNDSYIELNKEINIAKQIIDDNKWEELKSNMISNSQEDVFNALTNNGDVQSLFLDDDGNIFLNAKFLQTRGLNVVNDDNQVTLSIDENGNLTTSGDIVGGTITGTKLQALTIDTNEVNIESKDGGMVLKGALQKFTDENGNVRILIGKDTDGLFKFVLYSDDGESVLIDKDGIKAGAISAGMITGGHISSDSINTKHLQTEVFETVDAKIENAVIGKADITELNAIKGNITQLESEVAKIGVLESDVADIEELLAGNITAENIASGTITAGSGIIADGAIGSAQISSLDASKIQAGTVDTSKVTIQGADGHLRLKGNRLQVFQGVGSQAVERVSVGDVNGNGSIYGLRVRGADGTTVLLDENGVTSEGITDGSITNEKVSDDANIDGAKLNINSVVNKINEDGTEVIKGTKIEVNGTSLVTQLSTMTSKQTEQGEKINQNTSSIKANENAIKLKVDNQTYQTDKTNMTSTLNKHTSEISVMQGEIALKVEQSDIETANNTLKSEIQEDLNDINDRINDILDDVGGAIADGILDESETIIINSSITQLNKEKETLTQRYNYIYGLSTLASSMKSSLKTMMDTYNTKQSALISHIQSMITDKRISDSERTTYNTRLTEYSTALANVNKKIEECMDSISSSKVDSAKAEIKVTTDAISQNVSNLSQTVSTKADGSTVTAINNKVGTLETSVNGISGKVTNLEKTTTNLGNSVSGVQGEVETLKSDVASLEVTTSGISQKVSNVETTTSSLTQQVTTAQNTANSANTNATNAMNKANSANSLADSKAKVFTTTPTVPYKVGDLWVQGTTGDVMKCKTARITGSYTTSDWEKASKYTDDTKANVVDGKVTTLEGTVSATTSKVAEITTNLEGITQRVSSTETTTTTLTKKVDTVENTANTAKNTADSAKTTATQAQGTASTANTNATNALNKAETATAEITKTNQKVSSIETNLGSITSRVESVESTTRTIDGKVTSLETWKKSAEQKITDDAIISTVKASKNTDGKNTFAQQSDITQLNDSWTVKFNDGYNQGITTINKNGITVTSTSVNSKTSMSANGFKITKTDTNDDIFKVNSDGTLSIKGKIEVGSTVPTGVLNGVIGDANLSTAIKNGASAGTSAKNQVDNWTYSGTTEINGNSIRTGTLSASKITTGTLDATKVSVTNLNASNITTGTLSADRISVDTLRGKTLTGGTISGGTIDIGSGKFKVDTFGNVTTTGNVALGGTITANGNITATNLKLNGGSIGLGTVGSYKAFEVSTSGRITVRDSSGNMAFRVLSNGNTNIGNGRLVIASNGNLSIRNTDDTSEDNRGEKQTELTSDGAIKCTGLLATTSTFNVGGDAWSSNGNFKVYSSGQFQNKNFSVLENGNISNNRFEVTSEGNISNKDAKGNKLFQATTEGNVICKSISSNDSVQGTIGDFSSYVSTNGIKSSGELIIACDNQNISYTGNSAGRIRFRKSSGNYYFDPHMTNAVRLGSTNYLWNVVYATNGVKTSSDRNSRRYRR